MVFEVECIDRMYLNVYVPQLQYAAGLVGFVHRQLGLPIASTAPLAPISDGLAKAMRRFARDQGVPWVDFVKGQRKDDVILGSNGHGDTPLSWRILTLLRYPLSGGLLRGLLVSGAEPLCIQ
ncbi:MAG: hypothetical protein ACRDSR_28300, partial [Pseudonocardiaceae bacterium]